IADDSPLPGGRTNPGVATRIKLTNRKGDLAIGRLEGLYGRPAPNHVGRQDGLGVRHRSHFRPRHRPDRAVHDRALGIHRLELLPMGGAEKVPGGFRVVAAPYPAGRVGTANNVAMMVVHASIPTGPAASRPR